MVRITDAGIRQLPGYLAHKEQRHEAAAEVITAQTQSGATREEYATARRLFVLRIVQPGLAGLMDGSVSTLAPLFAAAELAVISWVRHRYMDTPPLSAALQAGLGGALVFLANCAIATS